MLTNAVLVGFGVELGRKLPTRWAILCSLGVACAIGYACGDLAQAVMTLNGVAFTLI